MDVFIRRMLHSFIKFVSFSGTSKHLARRFAMFWCQTIIKISLQFGCCCSAFVVFVRMKYDRNANDVWFVPPLEIKMPLSFLQLDLYLTNKSFLTPKQWRLFGFDRIRFRPTAVSQEVLLFSNTQLSLTNLPFAFIDSHAFSFCLFL